MAEEPTPDAAFAAEADIDHRTMRGSGKNAHVGHTGEELTVEARGGIDSRFSEDLGEDSPLLGNNKASDEQEQEQDQGHWSGDDFKDLPWHKRPSLFWVLFPFFILAVSFGGIIAPRVNLILNLICREYLEEQETQMPGFLHAPVIFEGANPQCRIPAIQSRAAQFTLYGNLIAGLLSAFTSAKLGALSDRYGRTKMIALTSMGSLAGDIFVIMAATKPDTFPVNWILVGYALDGICGSFTTAFALVHAYVTDCVQPAYRNVAFGYFHACLFTGIAVGPLAAGFLTKQTGTPVTSFYIMLGVHVFFMLWVGFITPESLSKSRQMKARELHDEQNRASSHDWIDYVRQANVFEPLKVLWPQGPGSTPAIRRNLVILAAVDTILFGVAMGSMTVILIYTNYQFGWDTYESSVFLSIVNSFRVFCLIAVLPLITRLVRGKPVKNPSKKHEGSDTFELVIIRFAVFFDTLGYLGYALARTGPLMIFSGVVASIGGIGSPTLQSSLTKHVPPEKTGQLLGAVGLLHALARVVAPTVFNAIYSATVGGFTQAVFVCLTATFGVAFIFSLFARPKGMFLH